jgi:hypothetical protein
MDVLCDQNIYSKKSSRVNCRERAYPAAPNPAAAGKGHIWQVLKPGSISNRATKKLSLIQVFSVAPLIYLNDWKLVLFLGLKKVIYPRSCFIILVVSGCIELLARHLPKPGLNQSRA